jgi:hypothetical protein
MASSERRMASGEPSERQTLPFPIRHSLLTIRDAGGING